MMEMTMPNETDDIGKSVNQLTNGTVGDVGYRRSLQVPTPAPALPPPRHCVSRARCLSPGCVHSSVP